jgi:hypothetical protein
MIECFDGDLSEDDLYAHLAGGDSVVGDSMATFFPSDEDAVACDVEASNGLGVSTLVAESLGNLLLN